MIQTCNSKHAHMSHAQKYSDSDVSCMPTNPRACTACSQLSRDVLSVCVWFFVCLLARLASSSPCQQSCRFLACRANFKTCKESHREEEAGHFQIPLNWATVLRAFWASNSYFTFSTIKTKTPPPLSQNQPATDLFLHVTAVRVFHLKAFYPRKRYILLLIIAVIRFSFPLAFVYAYLVTQQISAYDYRRENSRHFVVCDMYKHVTLNTMLHFKR